MSKIRIDHKEDGENVLTQWVEEDGDTHSMMGRLLFSKKDFEILKRKLTQTDEADGFESSHYFNERS